MSAAAASLINFNYALLLTDTQTVVQGLANSSYGWIICSIALLYTALVLAKAAFGVIHFIFVYFLRPAKNLKFYGSWAMVTGATDGIGKAYCVELAKKGLNIIAVSRTQSRLDELAQQLTAAHSVDVRTFAADLSALDAPTLARLRTSLQGLDVGMLVNNAGLSYDHPEFLEQTDPEMNTALIAINTAAPMLLSHMVLPGMKERGRGVIVNIGSANGSLPAVPLLSTYAGSKAFISQFTRSLDVEARPFGVRVQDQCPMFVATKMSKIRKPKLDAPSPEVWAKAAVRQVGYETVRTPYWVHGVMTAAVGAAPTAAVVRYVHKLHLGFRVKFYKRQARDAAAAAAGGEPKKAR